MNILVEVQNALSKSNTHLLNKKDNTEVYETTILGKEVILKIHREKLNFHRECTSLLALENINVLTPRLMDFSDNFEINGEGYLIQEKLPGQTILSLYNTFDNNEKQKILYDCGKNLGKINTALSMSELEESGLWKFTNAKKEENFENYSWVAHFLDQIPVWINKIKKSEDSDIDYKVLENLLLEKLSLIDDTNIQIGLVHRDYGFRNILIKDNLISGIIDFEHAIVGDILFDTSKFIFNDLDFNKDIELKKIFLSGWKDVTNNNESYGNLWLYLAVQGLGAIQWVDGQKSENNRIKYIKFRNKGKEILLQAYKEIS